MPDFHRSFLVAVYGPRASFHPSSGEMMALVEVSAGLERVLVDPERDRCRLAGSPGPRDLDRWTSAAGLVMTARRGLWGVSIVEDHYRAGAEGPAPLVRSSGPRPVPARVPREPVPSLGRSRRASVPEDLCSCLRCRDIVIVRRPRRGGPARELSAPGRLYRRAVAFLGELSACQGPGAAGVEHGRDCPAFDFAAAGPIVRGRRARGTLLAPLVRWIHRDPVARGLVRSSGPWELARLVRLARGGES